MALPTESSFLLPLSGSTSPGAAADLSTTLQPFFARQRPYFNEFIHFGGQPAARQQHFDEWRKPASLSTLLACYGDHIYRHHPHAQREPKPLVSLWAQWFTGLLVPPLMMALLTQRQGLDISHGAIATGFHEAGRAATFWIAGNEDPQITALGPRARLEALWTTTMQPVVDRLAEHGGVSSKLIWSNTGYLVGWFLGELKPLLGDALVSELRHSCFNEQTLLCGAQNPLFRTMLLRDGLYVRRTCCQRYRLPDVKSCGDCTLK